MGIERTHSKILIVEGFDDLFSVVGLMKHHADWPPEKDNCPVYIEVGASVTEILDSKFLPTKAKEQRIRVIGVMLDADDKTATGRYQRLRGLLLKLFPHMPDKMPKEGLIVDNNADNKRLGIWLMPDNESDGYMEMFLKHFVPAGGEHIWQHAVASAKKSREMGAQCRDTHIAKSELFTWLAWQDEPGHSPGIALTKKILDPHCSHAGPFVEWFKKLYSLQ